MTDTTNKTTRRQSAFDRELAAFIRARDTLDALPDDATMDEESLACDAMGAAERRLYKQTPQSIADIRALAEVLICDPHSIPPQEYVTALLNGLRRFDDQPSRVFNPAKWVDAYRRFGGGWVVTEEGVQLLMPVPASDTLETLMWELRTRGGEDAVKEIIKASEQIVSPDTDPAPAPSKVAVAFEAWKLAELTARQAEPCADELMDQLVDREREAFDALQAAEPTNAEDMLLKVFPVLWREFEPRADAPPLSFGQSRSYTYEQSFYAQLSAHLGQVSPALKSAMAAPHPKAVRESANLRAEA